MQVMEIVEIAFASFLFLFVKSFRLFLWRRISKIFPFKSDKVRIDAEKYRLVMEHLISIRSSSNAIRARVFQFHNGGVFTTKNPIWRMTCTYESCRSGISYESQKIRDMCISHLVEFLSFLWNPGLLMSGIKDSCRKSDKRCEKAPIRNCYKIYVIKLKESFFKSLLINSGIEVIYIAPLINEYDLIIGFITIEYEKEPSPEVDVCQICHTANNISSELSIKD